MDVSPYDRPMGRALELFLRLFGVLLGALVIGATVVALAVIDDRSGRRDAPALAAAEPVPTTAPLPPPPAPGPPAAPDPVQQAQREVDALVPQFAQSLDTDERRDLLVRIRRLAATPGVTVPYR